MRRLIARALGSLALGALLAVGVGSVASSADAAPVSHHPTVAAHPHMKPQDWWT